MVAHVIDDYRKFGQKAEELYGPVYGEMDGTLLVIFDSIVQFDMQKQGWWKNIFKNPKDALLFLDDLKDAGDWFRISDKIYYAFTGAWDFDHFNSSDELAEHLVVDDELSELIAAEHWR